MHPTLAKKYARAIEDDVANMSQENRDKLTALIPQISQLYRSDSTRRGVLIVADDMGQTVFHINADEFEAYGMIHEALPMHDKLLRQDQPDTGLFN